MVNIARKLPRGNPLAFRGSAFHTHHKSTGTSNSWNCWWQPWWRNCQKLCQKGGFKDVLHPSFKQRSFAAVCQKAAEPGRGGWHITVHRGRVFLWTKTSRASVSSRARVLNGQPLKCPAVAQSKNNLHPGQYGNNYWVNINPDVYTMVSRNSIISI